MIKHQKIEALLLSGDKANIELGLALAESQQVDIQMLLENMAQFANFLVSHCGYMIYYDELERLPLILAEIDKLEVESLFLQKKILELPDKLQYLPNLEKIYLVELGARSLPRSIEHCQFLSQLNLMGNELRNLPKELASCKQLKIINLSHNPLSEFPIVLCNLRKLEQLYLYQAGLMDLPEELSQLSNLKRLFLSNNLLFDLPESFGKLKQLKELDLSRCNLEELPESFLELNALVRLDIMDNPLKKWPKGTGLNALEYLSISNFPMHFKLPNLLELALVIDQKIPPNYFETLLEFTQLEKLQIFVKKELEQDAIHLPETLLSLKFLKKVELNNLRLKSIPEAYKRAFHLEEFYLFNTELEHLAEIRLEFAKAYEDQSIKFVIS